MVDDVLLNKAATIEHCVARAREEYQKDPATFKNDHTRLDAAILNIQRACEATIDMGQYLIRQQKLGLPQSARDVFHLLAEAKLISTELSQNLQNMVGFRNIAVHDYQKLNQDITEAVILHHLDDFLQFSQIIITGR